MRFLYQASQARAKRKEQKNHQNRTLRESAFKNRSRVFSRRVPRNELLLAFVVWSSSRRQCGAISRRNSTAQSKQALVFGYFHKQTRVNFRVCFE